MLLPSPLPGSLSIAAGTSGLYATSGFKYDYAVGSLPFLSGASRQFPMMRESAPIRKQQFDSALTPGEQSLEGWWLRSQQSFHSGAGQLFGDPTQATSVTSASAATTLTRFYSSRNVNVWTEGRAFLLNRVKKAGATPVSSVVDATEFSYTNGTNAAMCVAGSTITVVLSTGVVQSTFTASGKALQSVTTDGTYMYVCTADGVYSAAIPSSSSTAFTWAKEYSITAVPDQSCHMAFVKQRIMLGVGRDIYELTPHPATPPAALPTSKYTSPITGMTWTGFTESAQAIYAVGNNTVRGSVLKFTLSSTGTIPTLTAGAVACQLPSGEVPYSAIGYLGAFVGLGTNKGVRVATADTNGDLTYGPLLFSTATPVRGWSARDRYLYCTVSQAIDGDSGLFCIDLGNQIADLRFAYASDLNYAGDSGACNVCCHLGSSDLKIFATAGELYVEDDTQLAATGYLRTSRIRFSTLEPKLYKLVKVRGKAVAGPLAVTFLDQGDHEAGTVTFALGTAPGDDDVSVTSPSEPQDYLSLKFTLQKSATVNTDGGEISGYQLKALPGVARQRILRLPLLAYDFEKDAMGNRRGHVGSALGRLMALEDLEDAGGAVVLQDFTAGLSLNCVIEGVQFQQNVPPPSGHAGFGGVVNLTLRTV